MSAGDKDSFEAILARYTELRDSGLRPVDALREVGEVPSMSHSRSQRFERWYRASHGLPARTRRDQLAGQPMYSLTQDDPS